MSSSFQTLVVARPWSFFRKVAAEEEIGARGWDKVPPGVGHQTNAQRASMVHVAILSESPRISRSFLYLERF